MIHRLARLGILKKSLFGNKYLYDSLKFANFFILIFSTSIKSTKKIKSAMNEIFKDLETGDSKSSIIKYKLMNM